MKETSNSFTGWHNRKHVTRVTWCCQLRTHLFAVQASHGSASAQSTASTMAGATKALLHGTLKQQQQQPGTCSDISKRAAANMQVLQSIATCCSDSISNWLAPSGYSSQVTGGQTMQCDATPSQLALPLPLALPFVGHMFYAVTWQYCWCCSGNTRAQSHM